MPVPVSPISWAGSLGWLAGLAAVSFAVSWIAADMLRLRRTPYIAVLVMVTAAMTAGYIAWTGISAVDVLTARWGWACWPRRSLGRSGSSG